MIADLFDNKASIPVNLCSSHISGSLISCLATLQPLTQDELHLNVSCESGHRWDWCKLLFSSCKIHCSLPLKIIITFQIQGALNLALFDYSWALKYLPSNQALSKEQIDNLQKPINNLLREFLLGSTAAGFTLCIAAFTQLNNITSYHLYLCYTLLSALSPPQCRRKDLSDRNLGLYILGNQLLLVAMNVLLIYRLRSVWDNTGGKCFIVWIDGNGSFEEREDAVLWLYINVVWSVLAQLVYFLLDWWGRSKVWAPQNPKVTLILTILFVRIPDTFYLIWNLFWTIKLTIANQFLIDDNEFILGFGQVGALVTLCISICRAYISYKGARRILYPGTVK